mmetsp:Transcript_10983/g.13291  ORF Transcript_10983/g.13291 Transcript_10983/m.13291 type:complete len:386 (+) Transcript_10983:125-1282(+)
MALGRKPPLAEFQAVILACAEEGIGLYPLTTDEHCTSLLPVANRPLLSYQLNLLDKAKFSSVLLVTFQKFETKVRRCVDSLVQSQVGLDSERKMAVDLIALSEKKVQGTLDILRQIKHKLFTDFILISGDLVTEASIHHLADVHRIKDSTVTLLLKERTEEEMKKYRKENKNNELVNYFGVVRNKKNKRERYARLVYRKTALADESIAIPKTLLTREPGIIIRSNLSDSNLYLFRHWILDLLDEERVAKMSSIQNDFIPYLIKMQYREPGSVLPEIVLKRVHSDRLETANSMSASKEQVPCDDDIVRCFSFIIPASESYCRRANNVQNFATMNHEIAVLPVASSTPWECPQSLSGKKFSTSGRRIYLQIFIIHIMNHFLVVSRKY